MKRILIPALALIPLIFTQAGCLLLTADTEKKCYMTVDYVYHMDQGTLSTGDFSSANYKTAGFSYTSVPVDKDVIGTNCPNCTEGMFQDTALTVSYDASTKELYIKFAVKDVEDNSQRDVYISGDFDSGETVLTTGNNAGDSLFCQFDFAAMQIHLITTTELKYKVNYDD